MKGKKNANNSAGFTLVELMVVMFLMTMLAGISMWGILSWQDHANQIERDEFARELYINAQKKITEYQSRGLFENWADELDGDENVKYMNCHKGDYSAYVRGDECISDTADMLFDMIDEYVYDKELLDADIRVELDMTGKVLAVYVTDAYD